MPDIHPLQVMRRSRDAGTIELQIPKLRQGSYFPALLGGELAAGWRSALADQPLGGATRTSGRPPARRERRGPGGSIADEGVPHGARAALHARALVSWASSRIAR